MVESSKVESIDPAVIEIMKNYAQYFKENNQPTEEQKAKMAEEEFMKSVKVEAERIFLECQPNENKRLLEAGFVDFYKKQKTSTDELGGYLPDYTDEQIKKAYEALNKINTEKDGVDLQEIMIGRKAFRTLMLQQVSTNQEQQNQEPKISGGGGHGVSGV